MVHSTALLAASITASLTCTVQSGPINPSPLHAAVHTARTAKVSAQTSAQTPMNPNLVPRGGWQRQNRGPQNYAPSERPHYKTLGVPPTATAKEITKAYRRLCVKHHPDKNGGDRKRFDEISEAYGVLGDEQKREAYDRFGDAGVKQGVGGGSGFGGEAERGALIRSLCNVYDANVGAVFNTANTISHTALTSLVGRWWRQPLCGNGRRLRGGDEPGRYPPRLLQPRVGAWPRLPIWPPSSAPTAASVQPHSFLGGLVSGLVEEGHHRHAFPHGSREADCHRAHPPRYPRL